MANGVVVQLAILSALAAAILMGLLIVYMKRRAHREASQIVPQIWAAVKGIEKTERTETLQPKLIQIAASSQPLQMETASASGSATPLNSSATIVSPISSGSKPPVAGHEQQFANPDDHNQRILAGISENIRKNPIKPVSTYSPAQYSDVPRDTEYVRIKKKIITPHGKVRFSILKDTVSTNMLAVFRRACLDWKTPNDLIAFLPSYLEPEAEILNNQLLLIGTPGHDEKLAIPIRSIDAGSGFRDCFDFVTDDRTAVNTPAVVLSSDDEFEIVSKGVITQPVFVNPERDHSEVKIVVLKSPEALQNVLR